MADRPAGFPLALGPEWDGTIQEFIAVSENLTRDELGRIANYGNPDDTLNAEIVRQFLDGKTADEARAWLRASDEWKQKHPPKPLHEFALQGPLVAKHGIFYDDTGPRLPQFYSCFPLIRIFHDDRLRFDAICEAGVRAGRHGIRFGAPLVEDEHQDGGYWVGCHVSPEMALDLIPDVLAALANSSLYAHIFGAYYFGDKVARRADWDAERTFIRTLCGTIRDAGLAAFVGLYEWRNEFNLTSPWGLSQESYTHGAEAMAIARGILGCPVTMGSPGEDDGLIAGTIVNGTYPTNDGTVAPNLPPGFTADIAALDFARGLDGEQYIKRIDRAYYDGRFHGKYKGASLWTVEPDGLNDDVPAGFVGDVYSPMPDRESSFGYQMRMALDGMAVSFLNGPGVRGKYAIDTGYGFHEFPRYIRAFIPQDIGTWTGPTFMVKDNQFITVLAEGWGYIGPPSNPLRTINGRTILTWSALFADGRTIDGGGPIGLEPGWKTVALKGTLA